MKEKFFNQNLKKGLKEAGALAAVGILYMGYKSIKENIMRRRIAQDTAAEEESPAQRQSRELQESLDALGMHKLVVSSMIYAPPDNYSASVRMLDFAHGSKAAYRIIVDKEPVSYEKNFLIIPPNFIHTYERNLIENTNNAQDLREHFQKKWLLLKRDRTELWEELEQVRRREDCDEDDFSYGAMDMIGIFEQVREKHIVAAFEQKQK